MRLAASTLANIRGCGSFCALSLALLGLVLTSPMAAAETAPSKAIAATVEAVIQVLKDQTLNPDSKRRHVATIISRRFDFRAMTNRVLATNWKHADKSQRTRITRLFRELLSNTYWRKFAAYNGESVQYLGEKMKSKSLATVATLLQTSTTTIPVDYMLYARDGEWLVYDVVIEQVSLVRNYRGSFQDIVRAEGLDGLIAKLELKVAETSNADSP